MLEPGKGKTKTGRLWAYVRDGRPWADKLPQAVAYSYSPDRKGVHPQGHLKGFRGVLHADGYAGFRDLYEPKTPGEAARIVEAACLAHVRRKFFDLAAAGPAPIAEEAQRRIGELYDAEPRSAARHPSDDAKYVNSKRRALREWLETKLKQLPQKSATAEAIRYALTRWTALARFIDDGTIEIDNNAAERAAKTGCSPARTRAANAPPASCR